MIQRFAVMSSVSSCPVCGHFDLTALPTYHDIPRTGIYKSSLSAPSQTATLMHSACLRCGHLWQHETLFPSIDYTLVNRGTKSQLPHYISKLHPDSLSIFDSSDVLIVDVGCNDGALLDYLYHHGHRNLIGIEPSICLAASADNTRHKVYNSYLVDDLVETLVQKHGKPRLIYCRHVLEHVPNPQSFLSTLKRFCNENTVVFLEVPDGTQIRDNMLFFEIWDEHLHHFSPDSLVQLSNSVGLQPLTLEVVSHLYTANILLTCKLQTSNHLHQHLATKQDSHKWITFTDSFLACSDHITAHCLRLPQPIACIGASHLQCNFLNYLKLGHIVSYMIDDDPGKIGLYPPVKDSRASIISSREFTDLANRGIISSLILTGFGYPRWAESLVASCLSARIHLLDILDVIKSYAK